MNNSKKNDITIKPLPVAHEILTNKGKTIRVFMGRKLAIKAKCTECMGWEEHPKNCTCNTCPLFHFRGKTLISYDKNVGEIYE